MCCGKVYYSFDKLKQEVEKYIKCRNKKQIKQKHRPYVSFTVNSIKVQYISNYGISERQKYNDYI